MMPWTSRIVDMHDIKPLCQSVISKDLFEYHGLSSELKSNNFYKLRVSSSDRDCDVVICGCGYSFLYFV